MWNAFRKSPTVSRKEGVQLSPIMMVFYKESILWKISVNYLISSYDLAQRTGPSAGFPTTNHLLLMEGLNYGRKKCVHPREMTISQKYVLAINIFRIRIRRGLLTYEEGVYLHMKCPSYGLNELFYRKQAFRSIPVCKKTSEDLQCIYQKAFCCLKRSFINRRPLKVFSLWKIFRSTYIYIQPSKGLLYIESLKLAWKWLPIKNLKNCAMPRRICEVI